ncbi:MAG TPA: aldose 1-epimerase [Caulobacteraceae bacterium]|nr:aldose 1-epimerase [Caulobacteraceae bacterium]
MTAVVLTTEGGGQGPVFTSASFLPGRGLMLERLTARLPGRGFFDVVDGGPTAPQDEFGNDAFSYGGAFLIPYANRIRGRPGPGRTIETEIAGKTVRLPANWSGKAPGAERYAMHGLILRTAVEIVSRQDDRVRARLLAGDFEDHWLSSTELTFDFRLAPTRLSIEITAVNVGRERMPIGIGWHPYFHLPSGDRRQAVLHMPAERRLEVDNYDAVLPTGEIAPVVGTPYDFAVGEGRVLGDLYLDDCFVDLHGPGPVATIRDAAGGMTLTLEAGGPVSAVQVYAPADKAFVTVEPQFNWADPFGAVWPEGTDTGMVWLEPGDSTQYVVNLTIRV